ncbi:hypothetical protein ABPG72_011378 [Tetrahymena utriculariae]
MDEGVYGLTTKQKFCIYGLVLAPILLTPITLLLLKDALVTIIVLQIVCYFGLPYLYIKKISKEKEISIYFISEFQNRLQQIKYGITFSMVTFSLMVAYYFFLYEFKHNMLQHLDIPIKYNALYLFLFCIFLAFVNPVMEEWFWRLFLEKTLGQKKITFIQISYMIFHYSILSFLMSWQMSILFTTTFFQIAKTFSYIKENKGIISCIIGHLGLSIACTFSLLDVLYIEWDHKMQINHTSQP